MMKMDDITTVIPTSEEVTLTPTPIKIKPTKIIRLSKEFIEEFTGRSFDNSACNIINHKIKSFISSGEFVLAGGSVTRYLINKGQFQTDFDIFYEDDGVLKLLNKKFEIIKTKHSHTFMLPIGSRSVKVQLIKKTFNYDALFTSFDITICQFAIKGHAIYTTEKAFADLINRKLVINNIPNPGYTKYRILKYMDLGFTCTPETAKWLIDPSTAPVLGWKPEY